MTRALHKTSATLSNTSTAGRKKGRREREATGRRRGGEVEEGGEIGEEQEGGEKGEEQEEAEMGRKGRDTRAQSLFVANFLES